MHHTHYANRLRVVQLLEAIYDHGLFDLVARHIIIMEPGETNLDSEDIGGYSWLNSESCIVSYCFTSRRERNNHV